MTNATQMLLNSYMHAVDQYNENPTESNFEARDLAWKALDDRITRIEKRANSKAPVVEPAPDHRF